MCGLMSGVLLADLRRWSIASYVKSNAVLCCAVRCFALFVTLRFDWGRRRQLVRELENLQHRALAKQPDVSEKKKAKTSASQRGDFISA